MDENATQCAGTLLGMHRILASGLLSAGIAGGAVLGLSGLAGAQTPQLNDCYASSCPTHVSPVGHSTDPVPVHRGDTPATPDSPAAVNSQPVASSSLAFTGVDAAGVAGVGLLLIGGGTVLVRTSRRRPTS